MLTTELAREDVLWASWARVAAGTSVPGVDGVTPASFGRELPGLLVDGKIANQRMLVQRQVREHQRLLPGGEAACARLTRVQRRIAACTDLPSLRGVEGACASIYWSQLRPLLAPYGFRGRSRHSRDIANASFNYASALLREAVLTQVTVAGLDTQVSFLHEPYRGRPSLVFDLMEEWRPVLLETTVLGVLALRMVQPEDLEQRNGVARLSLRARAQIIRRFEERLAAPISSRDGRSGTTEVRMREQTARLVAALRGGSPYSPFRWR